MFPQTYGTEIYGAGSYTMIEQSIILALEGHIVAQAVAREAEMFVTSLSAKDTTGDTTRVRGELFLPRNWDLD